MEEGLITTNTAPFLDNNRPDLLKWQLDPREVIDEIEHKLRGEIFVNREKGYQQLREPLVNEMGINTLMVVVEAMISKMITLSNFDEKEINLLMLDFTNNIIDMLYVNYVYWGINKSHLRTIRIIICNPVHATLKRALNGGEREFLKTTERRIESYSERPTDKKGLLSSFKI